MTRVMKFKAWNRRDEVMVSSEGFRTLIGGGGGSVHIPRNEPLGPDSFGAYNPIRVTVYSNVNDIFNNNDWRVLQYTGFRDRDGIEIYEGDIIRISNDYLSLQGVFEVGIDEYGFYYKDVQGSGERDNDPSVLTNSLIIGNVFENQHLYRMERYIRRPGANFENMLRDRAVSPDVFQRLSETPPSARGNHAGAIYVDEASALFDRELSPQEIATSSSGGRLVASRPEGVGYHSSNAFFGTNEAQWDPATIERLRNSENNLRRSDVDFNRIGPAVPVQEPEPAPRNNTMRDIMRESIVETLRNHMARQASLDPLSAAGIIEQVNTFNNIIMEDNRGREEANQQALEREHQRQLDAYADREAEAEAEHQEDIRQMEHEIEMNNRAEEAAQRADDEHEQMPF